MHRWLSTIEATVKEGLLAAFTKGIMADPSLRKLDAAIDEVASKIRRFHGRVLGEQNTKASLIEPILEALGWDVRDPDEVHREFKPTAKDCPVDFALKLIRKPRLFVEAKGLGEDLSDRKWVSQVLSYATIAGVEWCILSDGDEYRFYNASAPVDAEEKLFGHFRLAESQKDETKRMLSLISRNNLEQNLLDIYWASHFIDRRVRGALLSLVGAADKRLVRCVRSILPKLAPKEIRESIRRLDFRIEPSPVLPVSPPMGLRSRKTQNIAKPEEPPIGRSAARRLKKLPQSTKKPPANYGVQLLALIEGGFLMPPTKLFRKYRGRVLEATVLSDGSVEFEGTRHKTPSNAASIARGTITGQPMPTNGWSFWQFIDQNGKVCTLFDARERFIARSGK